MVQLTWSNPEIGVVKSVKFGWSKLVKSDILFGIVLSVALLMALEVAFIVNKKINALQPLNMSFRYHARRDNPELQKFVFDEYKALNADAQYRANYINTKNEYTIEYNKKFGDGGVNSFIIKDNLEVLKPNLNFRSEAKVKENNEILYAVNIRTDELSRRVTPLAANKNAKVVLFFGDSFVFGEGVEDFQTLPWIFAEQNPDYQVFNYGLPGSSPTSMLYEVLKFSELRYPQNGFQEGTIAIYMLIDDSIERILCRLDCYRPENEWKRERVNIKIEEGGSYQFYSDFRQRRGFIIDFIYEFFGKSEMFDFFGINYPPYIGDSEVSQLALILKKLESELKVKANVEKLIVVSYPESVLSSERYGSVFSKYGLEYWDITGLNMKKITDDNIFIPGDYHPTPIANFLVAEAIRFRFLENIKGKQ